MIAQRRFDVLLRLTLAGLVLSVAACGRPTGDFGRARPSALHDDVLPAIGSVAATIREEPVSAFNLTDDERELRDRAWAFVRPPHVGDWWLEPLVEGQRTRILPVLDPRFDPRRYYLFLRSDAYRSSDTRWRKVITDITADTLLVPPFCAIAARVRTTDAERLRVVDARPDIAPLGMTAAYARVEENNRQMSWVWRALAYRLTSYRHAIDSLQLETPSDLQWEANRAFDGLAGMRCTDAPSIVRIEPDPARRSRLLDGPDPFDAPVLQK